MRHFFIPLTLGLLLSFNGDAQVKIGGTAVAPVASAVLELDGGSSRGLLLPRMRKIDIDAIVAPAEGLTIYATDEQAVYLRKSLVWEKQAPFNLPYTGTFNTGNAVLTLTNNAIGGIAIQGAAENGSAVAGFSQNNGNGILGIANDADGLGGFFYNTHNNAPSLVSQGYTGIGPGKPTALLHVNGSATTGNTVLINDDFDPIIQFQLSGISKGFVQVVSDDFKIGTNITNDLGNFTIRTNGGDRVVVRPDGKLVLGSPTGTAPATNHLLAVKGRIAATEFTVTALAAWPDYVFDDSYQLQTLEETEAFIKANKHLPNIPAASVVEKEGFALGDMQKRMMEKIEELTLHLIEANKEIQLLKKQMAERN